MNSFGDRLRSKRVQAELTQKTLGKSLGVSHTTVSFWEDNKTMPKGENLNNLCQILRTDAEFLLYGHSTIKESTASYNVSSISSPIKTLPLISSVQAGSWGDAEDPYMTGQAEEWRETTANVSRKSFALKVSGDSMVNPSGNPSIPDGSIVIVDPEIPAENGKIVVAKLDDTQEVTLKKLVIDGPNKYLMPLNPNYRPIPINGNCSIVGVVKKVEIDL